MTPELVFKDTTPLLFLTFFFTATVVTILAFVGWLAGKIGKKIILMILEER